MVGYTNIFNKLAFLGVGSLPAFPEQPELSWAAPGRESLRKGWQEMGTSECQRPRKTTNGARSGSGKAALYRWPLIVLEEHLVTRGRSGLLRLLLEGCLWEGHTGQCHSQGWEELPAPGLTMKPKTLPISWGGRQHPSSQLLSPPLILTAFLCLHTASLAWA